MAQVREYEKIYTHNSQTALNYDERTGYAFEAAIYDVEKEILTQELKGLNTKKLHYMDFACGTGRILVPLTAQFSFKTVTGIDISENMINIAKKKVQGVTFIASDVLKKVPKKKYDLVTCFRLFLNLEPHMRFKILARINQMMNKDSILIVNNHMNRYSILGCVAYVAHHFFRLPLKGRKGSDKRRSIINTIPSYQFQSMLRKNGFRIVKTHHISLLPGYKHYLPLPRSWLVKVECFLRHFPLLRFFSKDKIYVCKKVKSL